MSQLDHRDPVPACCSPSLLPRWSTACQVFESLSSQLDQGFLEAAEVLSARMDPVELPHLAGGQDGAATTPGLLPDVEMPLVDYTEVSHHHDHHASPPVSTTLLSSGGCPPSYSVVGGVHRPTQ